MRSWWSTFIRSVRSRGFWLRLALCAGVIALLLWMAGSSYVMAGIQGGLARITGAVLNVLGERAAVHGNTVQTERFGISVVTACTGLFITGLFVVAVIAYPTRWRSSVLGVGIGIAGIFALNVVRLVSLYFVGVHFPGILDTVHLLVWQSLLIAFAVLLWLLWAGSRRHASRAKGATR